MAHNNLEFGQTQLSESLNSGVFSDVVGFDRDHLLSIKARRDELIAPRFWTQVT